MQNISQMQVEINLQEVAVVFVPQKRMPSVADETWYPSFPYNEDTIVNTHHRLFVGTSRDEALKFGDPQN